MAARSARDGRGGGDGVRGGGAADCSRRGAGLAAPVSPASLMGRRLKDQPIVARDRVRFVGERVAAVAANDQDTAEEALQLIDVEYEELPAVLEPSGPVE